MMNEATGQMVLDVKLVRGLPQAIEDWRIARSECQLLRTRETIGLYCEATDQLARALLCDLASEPGSSEAFERFTRWLVGEEEQTQ